MSREDNQFLRMRGLVALRQLQRPHTPQTARSDGRAILELRLKQQSKNGDSIFSLEDG